MRHGDATCSCASRANSCHDTEMRTISWAIALTVLVPEEELVSAREALEALTEPDDLIAEP